MTDQSAQAATERLCEFARDVRVAVVVDAEGRLAGCSDPDPERSRDLAGLVRELLDAVDAAAPGEPEQIEAQVDGGAVYAVRRRGLALAAVARRTALSSLTFYDLRSVLSELEGDRGR